jgi:hypothetical protein
MQKTVLSLVVATLILCTGLSTTAMAASTPSHEANLGNPPVTDSTAMEEKAHGPLPWYMCVGKLKLCGPRHIECGRCH